MHLRLINVLQHIKSFELWVDSRDNGQSYDSAFFDQPE